MWRADGLAGGGFARADVALTNHIKALLCFTCARIRASATTGVRQFTCDDAARSSTCACVCASFSEHFKERPCVVVVIFLHTPSCGVSREVGQLHHTGPTCVWTWLLSTLLSRFFSFNSVSHKQIPAKSAHFQKRSLASSDLSSTSADLQPSSSSSLLFSYLFFWRSM